MHRVGFEASAFFATAAISAVVNALTCAMNSWGDFRSP